MDQPDATGIAHVGFEANLRILALFLPDYGRVVPRSLDVRESLVLADDLFLRGSDLSCSRTGGTPETT